MSPMLWLKRRSSQCLRPWDQLEREESPLRFSPDAQELFYEWWGKLEERVREPELQPAEAFVSHLGKYRSLMPSLALIFHMCHRPNGTPVSIEAARMAAAWCDFLERHARKVYAVELNPGVESAHALAAKIKARVVEDGETLRIVYRKGWSHLKEPDQVDEAVSVLIECGWVRIERVDAGETGGRPSIVLRINPKAYGL